VFSAAYALARTRFYSLIKPLSYLDIELLVGKGQEGVYPVTVTRSPLGVGNGSFKSFLQDEAFSKALIKIREGKPRERHFSYPGQAASAEKEQGGHATKRDLLEVGNKLFQALFSAQVQRIYDRCSGEAKQEKKRLRLQLRVDADELANLPWELLHDTQLREGFLALSREISLTRRFQVTEEINPEGFHLPLRILVMISSPHGLPSLKVEKERSEIQKALRGLIWLRDIQIVFTEKATPEELEKYLDRGIQVFHFIGHGDFNSQTREGMLAFETDNDELNWVEADRLAYLLRKSQVRLVILNSCETAEASSVDAFTGVAQKLINVGIPEVIAMQFPIADDTAILFSEKFYSHFIRHNSVDEAVAEARRAIMAHQGVDKIDWAIPVLFKSETEGLV
jgi:CHAT domain-containing protein